jgi:hypothetical protein
MLLVVHTNSYPFHNVCKPITSIPHTHRNPLNRLNTSTIISQRGKAGTGCRLTPKPRPK